MPDPLDDPRFRLTPNGAFRERFGPLGKGAAYSQKKLCLVATDAAFLVELLYGISQRSDCFYIKYGTRRRDGMVLARCFFTTDAASAQLCQALKGHPRLMVSVQDDDFFNAYREAPIADGACGIWDDMPHEATEVLAVHEAAFGQPDEARMVKAVIDSGVPVISLAAGVKSEADDWRIVGHVLLSPVTVTSKDESHRAAIRLIAAKNQTPRAPNREQTCSDVAPKSALTPLERSFRGETSLWRADRCSSAVPRQTDNQATTALRGLGLAPVAVLPQFQRRGFGSQLVRAALERARALGYGYVVVLGHAEYYPRFGFVPASRFGLQYEVQVPDENFMAVELVAGALDDTSGVVRFHDAFR